LTQLISSRYCIETRPNHFHCHSWSGTDTAFKNQTKPFSLPQLVRNRFCIETIIATAGQEHIVYCIETKPYHFIATAGTDTVLKPNQTYCIETKPNHFHCHSWSGSGDIFGPENLMDKNVVLVTFNYRHTSN
jgi:hypothetical protein